MGLDECKIACRHTTIRNTFIAIFCAPPISSLPPPGPLANNLPCFDSSDHVTIKEVGIQRKKPATESVRGVSMVTQLISSGIGMCPQAEQLDCGSREWGMLGWESLKEGLPHRQRRTDICIVLLFPGCFPKQPREGWRGGQRLTIIMPKLFSQMRKPAETPHTRPVQRLLAGQCWTLDLNPLFALSPYSWLWR